MHYHSQRNRAFCFSALLLFSTPTVGQQPQKGGQEKQAVTITATEVVVDVIVTDKRNRMMRDLIPADFEIYEDGVKQVIKSVQLVGRAASPRAEPTEAAPPARPAARSARPPGVPHRMTNLIALVFDNLSMHRQSQVFARRAARDYIDQMADNDRLAVFGIDTRLFLVQTFTNDKKALKHAVDQVAQGTSRQFASSSDAIERLLQSGTGEGAPAAVRLAAAEAYTPTPGENLAAAIDAVLLNTFRSFEAFEREAQGRSTVLSLLSIIRGQQKLPGRKTVIFFSEGFSLPSQLAGQFQSVIGAANRANVAIYTIDAAGLRLESAGERASRELSVLADARARGADPTIVRGGESMLGRAESLSRFNADSVLTELAQSTGGLAIRNTNDLRSGLKRIDEDMRSYYLLTYAPTNQIFDGRFRTIEVKVKRPKVKVRARKGYFALRTIDASPVFQFEQPLLGLIYAASPPHDFAFKLAAMHFPTPSQAVSVPIVAQIPARIVSFRQAQPAATKKKKKKQKSQQRPAYIGQLGVLALVKDARGMVVHKLSQNYRLKYTAEQLGEAKKSMLIFYRNVQIPPGAYQVDVVARDGGSGHANVTRLPLIIPAPSSPALRISSIVPTKGSGRLTAGERDTANPFHFGQTAIMPNLDRRFSKSDDQMMFYFTVHTTPGASVKAKVEFLQAGQVLAQAPGALPAPDERGRIQFVASFPVAPFPVGSYTVRVTVDDGSHKASEETSFAVVN